MKKARATTPILAAVVTVAGCAPMEPEPQVVADDDEDCRMESPIGSHVKEEECDPQSNVYGSTGDARSDHDIDELFGDVVLEVKIEPRNVPEGKCGNQ